MAAIIGGLGGATRNHKREGTTMTTPTVPINPGPDPASRSVYALIFNGLTMALGPDQFMRLPERERIAAAIYDTLRDGGVEIRLTGLDRLRNAHDEITRDGQP